MSATHRTADQIVALGQIIDRCERGLDYGSRRIAELAADGHTDSPQYRSEVEGYRCLRDELAQARADYDTALGLPAR